MRTVLFPLVVVTSLASVALAICSLPPPIDNPPGAPPYPKGPPSTPGGPNGPTTPGAGFPRTPKDLAARTGKRSSAPDHSASWRIWWELNREHLLGLRQTIRSKDVVSGGESGASEAEWAACRAKVRAALRETADRAQDTGVRAAALRALGRAGDDEDAVRFLAILRQNQQRKEIYESAAIGLGCLPPVRDPAIRDDVRKFYGDLLKGRVPLASDSQRLAILAVSLRGREDSMLAMNLAAHCARLKGNDAELGVLLYACGLTRDPRVLSILIEGVRGKRIGGREMRDPTRGRAALGLALSGDPAAVPALTRALGSRRAGVHTRRSAALALGLALRSPTLSDERREEGAKALTRALARDRDVLVQGYAAVALGTAFRPTAIPELTEAMDRADRVVRPYAALGLGLAAKRSGDPRKVRSLLLRELHDARDPEQAAALSIAVGISGASKARDKLYECLQRKRLNVAVRAPAIQALGLLRRPSTEIEKTLVEALEDKNSTVVEDASLALGFLGQRTTARLLVDKLVETKVPSVQIHMVAALSHLGSVAAIDPLLEVLANRTRKDTMRMSAAAALGILADDRERDPLFEIDAHTNPYALGTAERALVVVY